MPAPLADYVALVRAFNPDGVLSQYPGSPALAQMLLRPQDELRAFELHPTEQKILRATLAGNPRATVYDGDGFVGLRAQLPPPSRRGAVLIDPSYEGNGDYGKVVASLREAIERFAEGIYLVWYPQVTKLEAAQLPRRLAGAGAQGLAARAADGAGARRARVRPGRQRRLRPQPAAHAACDAGEDLAVSGRRPRSVRRRQFRHRPRRGLTESVRRRRRGGRRAEDGAWAESAEDGA